MTAGTTSMLWPLRWSALTGMLAAFFVFALHNGTRGSLDSLLLQALLGAALFAGAAAFHNSRVTRS